MEDIEFKDEGDKKKFCVVFGTKVIKSFDEKDDAIAYQKALPLATALYCPLKKKNIDKSVRELLQAIGDVTPGFSRTIYVSDGGSLQEFDPFLVD